MSSCCSPDPDETSCCGSAPAKFHVSLNVTDLPRSIAFYQLLFGCEPAKSRLDYAKFELDEPPLVLSLNPTAFTKDGALNHFGMRRCWWTPSAAWSSAASTPSGKRAWNAATQGRQNSGWPIRTKCCGKLRAPRGH